MSTHDEESRAPEQSANDAGPDQPVDPFEPEAPAHVDADLETVAHDEDLDDEATADEAAPAPRQPS